MAKADYYAQLGVDRSANAAELKSAYRKLAKKYHPDVNPGNAEAEQKFKDVSEAYDVLKDDQSRAAYDQFGHAAFEQGGPGGMGGGPGGMGGGFSGFGDIGDIFEEFFGGTGGRAQGRGQRRKRRGDDLRTEVDITMQDAYDGTEQQINLTRAATCGTCNGSGAKPGSQPTTCTTCHGHGKVRAQQGFFTVERTCPSCQGAGEMISNPCGSCRGQGRVEKSENLSVNIPAGVDTGTRIRLSGKGEAGLRGAPAGDLYIFVEVAGHPIFERDGSNLYIDVPVPMVTATLGGAIEVPTLGGKMTRLQIEKGTQSGRKFRMRGKGMPALRGGAHGDQIVEIIVETPTRLSKKQINLLKEFDEAGDASPQTKGFIDRVKTLWS